MHLSIVEQSDLQSAITLSLFSNRGEYWGDALGKESIGSKLFQLKREPLSAETAQRAEDHARESLHWLVEKGLGKNISVKTRFEHSQLSFLITIDGREYSYGL